MVSQQDLLVERQKLKEKKKTLIKEINEKRNTLLELEDKIKELEEKIARK